MNKIAQYVVIGFWVFCLTAVPFQSAWAQGGPIGAHVGFWGGFTVAPSASSDDYDDDWHHDENEYDLDMEETWAMGVKVGYTLPHPWKYFSFEFEYSYLNPDIKRSILERDGSDFIAVEGDVKLHNFMLNLFLKYPLGRFHPYLGAGLGFSYSDMTATATQQIGDETTTAPVGDDYTSFAFQVLTGVDIDITNNLALELGYRYFITGMEFNNASDIYLSHSMDIDFTTSMLTLGLKILF